MSLIGATPIAGMVMLAAGGLNMNPPAMPSGMPNINIAAPKVSVQKAKAADSCATPVHDPSARMELPGRFAETGMKDSQVESFLSCVQDAVRQHAVTKLAHSMAYPLKVELPGKVLELRTAAQFKSHYQEIFGQAMTKTLTAAKSEELAPSKSTAVLDGGVVEFGPEGSGDSRIEISALRPAKVAK